jgi:Raf kinase inhibitor-like YbhB/YbcL family protein
MAFELYSTAFADGGAIPTRFTCDGENESPPLAWNGAPPETQAYALVVHDPDAPSGDFAHWVVYEIPPGVDRFDEGAAPIQTALEGSNDFGRVGYGGPRPPAGHGPHHYVFDLYALDTLHVGLGEGATRQEVENAILNHIIAKTQLTGTYERNERQQLSDAA